MDPEITPTAPEETPETDARAPEPAADDAAAAPETTTIREGAFCEALETRAEALNEAADGRRRVRVPIAQRGDHLNRNRRFYPWEILRADALRMQAKARRGELLMEALHRIENGRNVRSLLETVAKINDIGIDDAAKSISLEDIQFLETDAGRNTRALVEAGVPLEVSQRAEGTAEVRRWAEDGQPYHHVTRMEGDGYDFLPPGRAGVQDARIQLLLEEKRQGTQGDTQVENDEKGSTPAAEPLTEPRAETPPAPESNAAPHGTMVLDEGQLQATVAGMVEKLAGDVIAKLVPAKDERIEAIVAELNEAKAQRAAAEARAANEALLNEMLADAAYARFNARQKEALRKAVALDGTAEAVKARFAAQVEVLDEMLAASRLEGMGYAAVPGVQHVALAVNEPIPNAAVIERLNEEVSAYLKRTEPFYAKDGTRDYFKKKYLALFDQWYGRGLLNEAAGVAANVPQILSFSRVIMEQALPILTALDLVDPIDIPTITHTIYEEVYDQPLDSDISAMMVGENGTAPTTSTRMVPYVVYATDKKLRTQLTPHLAAMANGIPGYDITARNLGNLAKDYARRVDRLLYRIMIAAADLADYIEITSYENFTQVGSTKEYKSANPAWVQWEYFKKYTEGTNQPVAKLALIGEETGSIHQKVEIRDGSTVLTRGWLQPSGAITVNSDGTGGAADYYVKYADGSVVLASAPAGTVSGKYVYTRNTKTWSLTPASGVEFWDHLRNLNRACGDSQTLMKYRFYEPTRQVCSVNVANWISNSSLFTEAGRTPAHSLNADNSVGSWAGKPLFTSTGMVDDKIIYLTSDAVKRGIYQPWALEGPVVDTLTGNKSWIGLEFTVEDVLIKGKLASVTITT